MTPERWMYVLSFLGTTALSLVFTKVLFMIFGARPEDEEDSPQPPPIDAGGAQS